jgi:hypothetical protein
VKKYSFNFARARYVVGLLFLCVCFSSCVIPFDKKFVHDPPLSRNVGKIVKGKTTREEILRIFGPPEIEADGPNAKASPNLPEFRTIRESVPRGFTIDIEYPTASPIPYSSIDDEHLAYVYLEDLQRGTVVIPGPSWASNEKNILLIFIHKKTNVVDEFAYREQFKTE